MPKIAPVAFLLDVDDTLFDGDRLVADLKSHLSQTLGNDRAQQYWTRLESLRVELGCVDYLGALQRYRLDNPCDQDCLGTSAFLLDYPFARHLYAGALELIARLQAWGPTVILSDGDAVYQPRKIERSGLFWAADGHVLIYIHKEQALADVERQYPARQYVLIDDKLRILTAVKAIWRERVTTVFPRQGHYAHDPEVLATCPPADISVDRIDELLKYDLSVLVAAGQRQP